MSDHHYLDSYIVDGIDYFGLYTGFALGLLAEEEIDTLKHIHKAERMKFCTKCKQTKLISEFHANSQRSDGIAVYCKSCFLEKQRTPLGRTISRRSRAKRLSKQARTPATLIDKEWEEILTYYSHCCAYCGKPESKVGTLAQEHVYPISRGGGYTALNIVPACKSCNSRKSAHTPAEVGFILKRIPLAQLGLFDND